MIGKKAFSLVELILVVTLVAILTTIAYVYFDGNLGESRDAKRISDLDEIEQALEVYQTKKGFFPEPSNSFNVTYSGSYIAWIQGTLGETTNRELKVFGSQYPVDPLFNNEYTYSVTENKREFQLASLRENLEEEEGLGEEITNLVLPKTYAAEIQTAYVVGNYNGFMVQVNDGMGQDFYIATPSIISNDPNDTDVISVIENQKLVYNEFFNLPASYDGFLPLNGGFNFNVSNPIIFSGSTDDLKDEQELLQFNDNLKYIYATTPTESFDRYIAVLEEEGLTSLKKFLTKTFKIPFRSYFNCKDILDDNASRGDGFYMIDPDGPEGEDAYEVFCDMTTDGGGWTRVGDNHLANGSFSGGLDVVDAIRNDPTTNTIVALSGAVDGNQYALHQTGNYSSNYQVKFDDPSLLKQGYELRMTMWRNEGNSNGSGSVDDTKVLGGKESPWTLGTCTSGHSCYFQYFNSKMAHAANFGDGLGNPGNLTDIQITTEGPTTTVTNSYLNGGVLFDGFVPSDVPRSISAQKFGSSGNNNFTIQPYSSNELDAINDWVEAGGFLVSTNNEEDWDPIGEYYGLATEEYNDGKGVEWIVQNVNHPIVNGTIGLKKDLRGDTLFGAYAHAAFEDNLEPDDIVLARDKFAPNNPTVVLRKHGKGHILFISDDGMFVQMSSGNLFDANDNETVLAAAIMTYAIETAAGINPKDGYAFHNRIYYNDGTFSTNGIDEILDTVVVDGQTWVQERVRHRIYKTPESFDWYVGLDANNNKDLYFTGLRLELFYR